MEYLLLIILLGFLFAIANFFDQKRRRRNEEQENENRLHKIASQMSVYLDYGIEPIKSNLRSKKGEVIFASAPFMAHKYKSTGVIAAHALRYRLKLAKGLSYHVGVGRFYRQQDIVADGVGRVTISNQAIIFTNKYKAKRFTWSSIAVLEACVDGFVLTPCRGPVLYFSTDDFTFNHAEVLALIAIEEHDDSRAIKQLNIIGT